MLCSIVGPGAIEYTLIRKLRALPPDRAGLTPAAALTGLSTGADRARALRARFQFPVAKPVDVRRLVAAVATMAAHSWNCATPEGTRQGGPEMDTSKKASPRVTALNRESAAGCDTSKSESCARAIGSSAVQKAAKRQFQKTQERARFVPTSLSRNNRGEPAWMK